jgi:hypothetical protein
MSVPTKSVIPGREACGKIDGFVNFAATSEPGIHNQDREHGFRACATLRRPSPTGTAHPGMTRVGFVAIENNLSEIA